MAVLILCCWTDPPLGDDFWDDAITTTDCCWATGGIGVGSSSDGEGGIKVAHNSWNSNGIPA